MEKEKKKKGEEKTREEVTAFQQTKRKRSGAERSIDGTWLLAGGKGYRTKEDENEREEAGGAYLRRMMEAARLRGGGNPRREEDVGAVGVDLDVDLDAPVRANERGNVKFKAGVSEEWRYLSPERLLISSVHSRHCTTRKQLL